MSYSGLHLRVGGGVECLMFDWVKSEIRSFFSFPAFLPFLTPMSTFSMKTVYQNRFL